MSWKNKWNNKTGFHYRGKDKRGVSRWSGSWDKALRGVAVGFLLYGGFMGIAAFSMLAYALLTLSWPAAFNPLFYIACIHMLTFGGIGLWSLRMRRHILSLATPDQVSERFGMTQTELEQVALEKGIKPRMNLNGMDYYNPADFDSDAVTLLRGTTRPHEGQEVLLRPARGNETTSPDQLLRVPDTTALPDSPRFTVSSASSADQNEEVKIRA